MIVCIYTYFYKSTNSTKLLLKKLSPTRLVANAFSGSVQTFEDRGASADELRALLGKGRAKKGIFEGDLDEGALEIGQTAGSVKAKESVSDVFRDLTSQA